MRVRLSIIDFFTILLLVLGIGQLATNSLNYIMLFLVLVWILFGAVCNKSAFIYCINQKIIAVLLFYIIILTTVMLVNTAIVDVFKVLLLFIVEIFPLFLVLYYKAIGREVFLYKSIGIILTIIQINAILFFLQHPGAARVIAANGPTIYGTNIMIGGGYPLTLLSCIWGLVLMILLKEKKSAVLLLCFVVSFIVVLLSQSTIFFGSFIIGVLLIVFFANSNRRIVVTKSGVIGLAVSVLAIIIVYYFVKTNVSEIISVLRLSNNVISVRLISLLEYLFQIQSNSNSVELRMNVYNMTLDIIKQYPILGMGFFKGFQYADVASSGLGNHSEIADLIATQGIFCIPLVYVLIRFIKDRVVFNNNKIFVYIFAFIVSILNPTFSFPFSVGLFCLGSIEISYKEEVM